MDKDGKAGKNYKGSVAKTISGKECQKWSEQKPQKHGFGDVGDHNFCRNPEYNGGVWGGVWCYTTDTKTRWEACDVPKCDIGGILQKCNFKVTDINNNILICLYIDINRITLCYRQTVTRATEKTTRVNSVWKKMPDLVGSDASRAQV